MLRIISKVEQLNVRFVCGKQETDTLSRCLAPDRAGIDGQMPFVRTRLASQLACYFVTVMVSHNSVSGRLRVITYCYRES